MLARLPGAMAILLRGAFTSIIGNLSLAALALALALSLWLYVTERENPTETRTFQNAIPISFVNVPNELAVSNTSDATVRIRIEAPESDFAGLTVDDFDATVDLGGLTAGLSNVTVDVSSPSGRVNVVSITPASVDVTLEPRRSREVPVEVALVGQPQTGFAAADTTTDPETVTVTGPESIIQLVDSVVAEVNLTGLRVDLSEDRVPLQPRDARGGALSRVTVNPQNARVSVELEQREFSSEYIINPVVVGQPAGGYNVTDISVEPRIVLVTGSLEALESIDAVRGIPTEEISIADARDTVTRNVQLVLPPGARVQGNPSIRVSVGVEAAQGEFTFLVVPQVQNVASALTATPAEPIAVTLSGEVPVLREITAQEITVTANAQGLDAGLYVLPLQITPPPNTSVVRVEPGELGVSLRQR